MLYRLLTFLVFTALVVSLGEWDARNQRFGFSEKINNWWLDFCVGNARDKISDPAVTFVGIGDDFEPVLEGESLSRLDYGVLLGNLEYFKPRAVAIAPVISFPEPSVLNQGALKKQVLKMPRLTLGSTAENGSPPADDSEKPDYPVISAVDGDLGEVPAITRMIAGPDEEPLANGVAAPTSIELSAADDTPEHHIPLLGRVADEVVATFALQALIADADLTVEDVSVTLPPASEEAEIRIGERYRIPIDAAGRLSSYPHSGVAPSDVYRRKAADDPRLGELAGKEGLSESAYLEEQKRRTLDGEGHVEPPRYPVINARHLPLATAEDPDIAARRGELGEDFDSLSGNLIVVGNNGRKAPAVTLPTGESFSQHELIARAIAIVQSGRYIERWPDWAKYAGIALIVVLAALLFRLNRGPLLFWGFVTAFLYVFGICLGSFKEWLVWSPPFVPLALFAGIIGIGLILPSAAERSAGGGHAPDGDKDQAGEGAEETPAGDTVEATEAGAT